MRDKVFEMALDILKEKTNDNFKIHFEVKNNKFEIDFEAGEIDVVTVIIEYIDHLLDDKKVDEDKIIELFEVIIITLDIKYDNFSNKLKNKLN